MGAVTQIWDFVRCEEDGCKRPAWYRLFSRGNECSYFVCIEHVNRSHCPFEIDGMAFCPFRRRRLRSRQRLSSRCAIVSGSRR